MVLQMFSRIARCYFRAINRQLCNQRKRLVVVYGSMRKNLCIEMIILGKALKRVETCFGELWRLFLWFWQCKNVEHSALMTP